MSFFNKIKSYNKLPSGYKYIPFKTALHPYLLLFVLSIGIYFNTFNHEVAFDDESVLHKNEFVIMGLKGIPGILTHDSYYSYYKQLGYENNLPGGRYRPLSQISFAIEQEFIGTIPDGIVRDRSWDVNQNGVKDQFEDTNGDGIFTEYDFWSKGSGFRHMVNVFLYGFLIVLIYHVFSNNIFNKNRDMVFLSVLLFSLHPLHTEVVANIKSRDEILSLLLIFLTLHFTFSYLNARSGKNLFSVSLFMFLSLLSKEYALLLFCLVPAILFVYYPDNIRLTNKNFWLITLLVLIASVSLIKFFNQGTLIAVPVFFAMIGFYLVKSQKDSSVSLLFALGSGLVLYLAMRFAATTHDVHIATFETDVIANPYKFASVPEKWASKIAIWIKYIYLFFFPHPLLVDYSYKTIPYSNFFSFSVWLSILFYSLTIISTIITFFKRSVWFLPLIIFIGFFIPVANVFIDIGATMGERLFFHSSLGFCMLLSMIIFYALDKFNLKSSGKIITILILILSLPLIVLSVNRNPDWKNNNTLFLHDVNYAPDNINILSGAGVACYDLSAITKDLNIRNSWIKKANAYYDHSLSIIPDQFPVYYNKSVNFLSIGELDSALNCIEKVLKIAPNAPNAQAVKQKISNRFMYNGVSSYEKGDRKKGMELLLKSISINKKNDRAWNNLGKVLLDQGAKDKALTCYTTALQINPENKIAKDAISKISLKEEDK
jgi:hypothetical protein